MSCKDCDEKINNVMIALTQRQNEILQRILKIESKVFPKPLFTDKEVEKLTGIKIKIDKNLKVENFRVEY